MINRNLLLHQIKPFIGTELIKVIIGVRRSGKSEFLKVIQNYLSVNNQVDAKQFIELNFEDLMNEPYKDYHKLNDFLEKQIAKRNGTKVYIFLDEIQEVTNFEEVINSLRARYKENVDIYSILGTRKPTPLGVG
ncbi:MAG: AAA family ATPase [Streptococcaceae bacterium]|jgi:predicted AAA+ superfamily ATPase|nr:AAA family ATPase [Streptococcaceae bacterium]